MLVIKGQHATRMQPLEIAKGIPAAIACKDDYDVGLASTTTAAVAAVTAADELNRTRSPSPELVTRRRSNDNHINNNNINNTTMPDSPRSFDSNELFEDVVDETNGEYGMDRITDDDLERLMWNSDEGQRRDYRRRQHNNNTARPSSMFQQYHRIRSWLCSCCPPRRQHKIGNMIILLPYYCVTKFKCGIMGPHWFGPVACFTLLSGATSRLVPRSYRTIGPITGQICLGLYLVSVLLLGLVVCRDPGVVRSTAMMEDEEALVEQENVDDEGTNGIDGRVESGRAGGRSGNGRGLTGRGSGGGLSEGGRGLNTNGIRRRGGVDWRYCDICR